MKKVIIRLFFLAVSVLIGFKAQATTLDFRVINPRILYTYNATTDAVCDNLIFDIQVQASATSRFYALGVNLSCNVSGFTDLDWTTGAMVNLSLYNGAVYNLTNDNINVSIASNKLPSSNTPSQFSTITTSWQTLGTVKLRISDILAIQNCSWLPAFMDGQQYEKVFSPADVIEYTGYTTSGVPIANLYAGRIFSNSSWSQVGGAVEDASYLNWSVSDNTSILETGAEITTTGAKAGALRIHSGAHLKINVGKDITCSGVAAIEPAEGLLIASDATGTGSFISNGLSGAGTAKVQRYIGSTNWADDNDGWHFLTSPVAAQGISGGFTPGTVTPDRYDFYAWGEATQTWLNQKVGGMPTFEIAKGYLVAYESASTKDFVGTLNTGNQALSVTKTGAGGYSGWNLLGNPFPSNWTWNGGGGSIGGVAQIWDNSPGVKDYKTVTGGTVVAAMNGIMVYTSANGTYTFLDASRTHTAATWYKSSEPHITLIAHDATGGTSKTSGIRFISDATNGFDLAYDAYMLSGLAPKFYSVAENNEFSLNTLPEAKEGLVIPFGFVKNGSTNFTIELAESLDGMVLALRDKKTNTTVNLSKNPVYSFTSSAGDDANRFELLFGSQLGVNDSKTLASASAYSVDGRIVINNVSGDTQMDIINVQGQLLNKYDFFSNGSHEVSVNLPTGVYMVRLSNGGELRTMKVFVK
jgi:hypothetical protein